MGLRFRKSVKICDGLRLNFGKTGASVTVGSGPFKKTFNTNGNVTTTVGIPGTGIYWTETERRGSRNNRRTSNLQQTRTTMLSQQSNYQVEPAVDDYFVQSDVDENVEAVTLPKSHAPVAVSATSNVVPHSSDTSRVSTDVSEERKGLSAEAIKRIYLYEDAPVDWTELVAGASAEDLLMDQTVHAYCAQMAPRILSGDVDAYLEVIERMRPVDDLALYSGDFEFGTDKPYYIEVEFAASPERVLRDGTSDAMLEEFVSAVTVRVARDLFALLPVAKVLVHVVVEGNTILSVRFERGKLGGVNFRNTNAKEIIKGFRCLVVDQYQQLYDVGRILID